MRLIFVGELVETVLTLGLILLILECDLVRIKTTNDFNVTFFEHNNLSD